MQEETQEEILEITELQKTAPAAAPHRPLPVVPYVRVLNNSDPSDCPYDRYMMNKRLALLEYSRDKKGGDVIGLKALLRTCPHCETMFIDQTQLLGLKNAGLDIGGFDIIGSSVFPRTKGYEKWHPTAAKRIVVIDPQVKVKAVKKTPVKKEKAVKAVKAVKAAKPAKNGKVVIVTEE